MNKKLTLLISGIILLSFSCMAQEVHTPDKFTLGLGVGLDYGGVGASAVYYPHKSVGVFGSAGYAIEGIGYNAGIKLRNLPAERKTAVPFFTAMYGYHTVVSVKNTPQYSGFAYGFTLGGGVDVYLSKRSNNYLSAAVLVPLRQQRVINRIHFLQNQQREDSPNLWPVMFSVGYKIPLL